MRVGKKNLLGTNVVTQVGIVVKDVEATSRAWADMFGVPEPGWSLTGPVESTRTRYKGEETTGRAKLAFFQFKNITIELIEPVGGPSTWQAFLDTKGEGVHHVAFNIRGKAGKLEEFTKHGVAIEQDGRFTGGSYAYVDTATALKVILELLA